MRFTPPKPAILGLAFLAGVILAALTG